MVVVPTAQTFFLFSFPLFTVSTAVGGIVIFSESILCFVKSSTSTERKEPKPTCKVNSAKFTPFNSNLFSNSLLKCKPAVGAATAPSFFANTVWYLSSSAASTLRVIYLGSGVSPKSRNIFLNSSIESIYPNFYYTLTNTIFQWNEYISIRWHYEYKNIFEKLNQPYDICFSVRHNKKNRTEILDRLSKLKNDRIYLSRVDNCRHKTFNKYTTLFEENVHNNITKGDNFEEIVKDKEQLLRLLKDEKEGNL